MNRGKRSYKVDSNIIFEINDNGVGFDIEKIRQNATGLKILLKG